MSLKRKIAEYEKQSEPPEPIAIPVLPAEEAPKKRPRIVTKKKAATKVFNPIIEFHALEPKTQPDDEVAEPETDLIAQLLR